MGDGFGRGAESVTGEFEELLYLLVCRHLKVKPSRLCGKRLIECPPIEG